MHPGGGAIRSIAVWDEDWLGRSFNRLRILFAGMAVNPDFLNVVSLLHGQWEVASEKGALRRWRRPENRWKSPAKRTRGAPLYHRPHHLPLIVIRGYRH